MKKNLILILLILLSVSCAKPLYVAKDLPVEYVSKTYEGSSYADVWHATRWALRMTEYPVKDEDKRQGTIITSWVSVETDSHYVEFFNRKDYGTTGSYHQLEIHVLNMGGSVKVEVGSRAKSMLTNLKSTKSEEKLILQKISDALRSEDIRVTNVGLEE
ncbi:hypothetical protein KKA47_01760 [bacterium]|nr:hypothetical protein [bacterium]